ncbi:HNH endonuclease family protein [Dactylosporangium sp. AC04546]|uniref:HNH endonuclease family protein n=1 Tax=Dactylosporangium sp. AC04546 TaxID=2862460 RepID=UPI001EE10C5C|nr:HNH endonuclease family protein [Dactylosporangium sp. AC04546]WVK80166.1 HNH endonuclease family protein [Dactylosporangium sp. AC04546]
MSRPFRWIVAGLAAVFATFAFAVPAGATPPGIPSKSTAQSWLNALTVATQGSTSGYSRDLFPHWITISGACNTRETVLKRDGSSVVTDSACAATSGRWYSPYDGATWTAASDVDIDHVVPLAEAWRSGASSWTTAKRQSFANDLTRPQLIAVTDNVNQSKGDQDPSTWQPPLSSYRCTYARMWIAVKYYWALTLQSSEKTALQSMLNTCA